ncbi:MAG: AAA family ATPase [Chitinophagales bacterium]
MQKSLFINNYKIFKHLEVDNLQRINLFIGKNNTGKSTLLEAIAALSWEQYYLSFLYIQLSKKKEWTKFDFNSSFEALKSLFHNQVMAKAFIGHNQQNGISFQIKEDINKNGLLPQSYFIWDYKDEGKSMGGKWKLEDMRNSLSFPSYIYSNRNCRLVDSSLQENNWRELAVLWGDIALSDKENFVIDALKIVEPKITRLSFIDTNSNNKSNNKKAIVRMSDKKEPTSLNSMGDGINRILQIILNLVHCENGILLIDEFENGLHWSVQKELWRIIVKMSEKLNIQVFAATHSRDTIWALQQTTQNKGDARIIKLKYHNRTDLITATSFEMNEINTALEQSIEIR